MVLMTFIFRRTISFSFRIMSPPDRWEVYRPLGSVIPGTKFIAFKVPLKEELLREVKEKDRFSPAILMKLLGEQGIKLGGVIDLTFTFKYYNREEFLKNAVEHKKIFTPGHDVPNENVFQEFAHAVKTFNAVDQDSIIGVHCTHGINRTGYLICRYMIEEMDYEPDDAIALFGKARGHELERENYLQDLRKRIKGQSSYDPNFKVQDVNSKNGQSYNNQISRKEKPRWRHHKDDHPEWRRKFHHSTQDTGVRCGPEFNHSSLVITGNVSQGGSQSTHREDWVHAGTENDNFGNTNHSVDAPVHGSSNHNWRDNTYSTDRPAHRNSDLNWSNPNIVDRSIHENDYQWRDNPGRNSPANVNLNPNRSEHGRMRGHHNSYYGHRSDPVYSYRCPDAGRDRVRKDGYKSHGKNSDSHN